MTTQTTTSPQTHPRLIPCPTGCGRSVRDGHVMCAACWSGVPKARQSALHRAWKRWRRDLSDAALMLEWQRARDAAIASLR